MGSDGIYEPTKEPWLVYTSAVNQIPRPENENNGNPFEQLIVDARRVLAECYQCSVEDFLLISYGNESTPKYALVYAAPNGIDLGGDSPYHRDVAWGYDAILADPRHNVSIWGKTYDTRSMTFEIYQAMIDRIKTQGSDLPDSYMNILDNLCWYSWTYVFDPGTKGANVRVFDDGSLLRNMDYDDRDIEGDRAQRLRPTVLLEVPTSVEYEQHLAVLKLEQEATERMAAAFEQPASDNVMYDEPDFPDISQADGIRTSIIKAMTRWRRGRRGP